MKFIDRHLWTILICVSVGTMSFVLGARWDEDYQVKVHERNVMVAYLWGEQIGLSLHVNTSFEE